MTKHTSPDPPAAKTKQVRLERTYRASIDEVWELWTTKEGIEAWWGPEGFSVTVHELDLRVGGKLLYAMTAVGAPQIEFMKKAGMPLTTESRITFREVLPPRRLVYAHLTDFIPGVAPYDVGTSLELEPADGGVKLVLTLDPMHSEEWTQRAVMGWEMELGKLAEALEARARR
jgi:uncharacterized protein YndB with AHSA1/START domain